MKRICSPHILWFVPLFLLAIASSLDARNPIRSTFFSIYPTADETQLDNLPSNSKHCGVCHFDFDGGGTRNPYGLAVEIGLNGGLSNEAAILAIGAEDTDGDGYINEAELLSALFSNTPTFPGLSDLNNGSTANVDLADIEPYLTPAGSTDSIPPVVTLISPNGGEVYAADDFTVVSYTATDESGVSYVNVYFSDDAGGGFKMVGRNEAPTGSFTWFIPNRPGTINRLRIEAFDNSGNIALDDSDADFTITGTPPGYVSTTFRDMDISGTQPFEGAVLDDPVGCGTCHGGYDTTVEPWHMWSGNMMGQAMRDPLFLACMAVAEQDAPSVGDLCIRCHSPGGWQEGRSVDTSGDLINEKDRQGIQCDFCHRMVDYSYMPSVSPPEDTVVLNTVSPLPLQYGNGQFINDPAPIRRGPYSDAQASHEFLASPFHKSADLCGTCHDVSNPVFVQLSPGDYAPNAFDEEHPDMNVRNMFPVERTYSEWSQSAYAAAGVYAPQFAGDKPDGIVSTCQDCHMRDVTGKGCDEPGAPTRTDLALHDMMGGNTFMPAIVGEFFPDETDPTALSDAAQRASDMLQLAATLEVIPEEFGITARVTNETGHKMPSGYPEGRRIWLNVEASDGSGQKVFESGAYNFETADLIHDSEAKVYEIHPGLSPGLAAALGMPAGPSFHFVLSDTVYSDNRIPPRGFINSNFETIQSPPIHYSYADGQHWDDTPYYLPSTAETVLVTLYYQTTTKEYVEFLRDENVTNLAGQEMYASWVENGKGAPVVMAQVTSPVEVTTTDVEEAESVPVISYGLNPGYPNPFRSETSISYSLPKAGHVRIHVYDITGRLVRSLVDGMESPGLKVATWDGRDSRGRNAVSGVYFVRYKIDDHSFIRRSVLLR